MVPRALSIAGSDPSGGAGIQADLKTFQAFSVYGMAAITALTAQNSQEVREVFYVNSTTVAHQIQAVLDDIGVDAVKIGMLGSAAVVQQVSEILSQYPRCPVVLDPVLRSSSGAALVHDTVEEALRRHLLRKVTVLTPNLEEASRLTGLAVTRPSEMVQAAERLDQMGCDYVLIKGGHLEGPLASDLLWHDGQETWFDAERVPYTAHGTGCTLSSAIAAGLAWGLSVPEAVGKAKEYVTGAMKEAPRLGRGDRPLAHDWRQKPWI